MSQRIPSSKETKEITAILVAILFLALGLAVLWFTKKVMSIEGDVIFVSLLLVPIIVYAIYAGKLVELKGPGGLEAKFTTAANESVSAASEEVAPSV